NDYRNKIEAGTVPLQRINNGKTDVSQWENVPKAVVEGLEGTLNVPVSDTVHWTNNVTYMLQSKNKETGERLSIIPPYTLNSTLSWQVRQDVSLQS
ncbi:TonB-dependent receptor domain-containing protein, partial [Salmonella enterica subsp. enterica serovar Infantis]